MAEYQNNGVLTMITNKKVYYMIGLLIKGLTSRKPKLTRLV